MIILSYLNVASEYTVSKLNLDFRSALALFVFILFLSHRNKLNEPFDENSMRQNFRSQLNQYIM